MMRKLIYLLLLCCLHLSAQEGRGDLRVVFYNVENLFDPFDDSLKEDEEFLPWGMKHWTWDRFREKEIRIGKVLASIGGWAPPELIGLCEVENRFVLEWLVRETPLFKYPYRIIHRDSPDVRGIDLALLYLPDVFSPLSIESVGVGGLRKPGRDLLYIEGLVNGRDTLHLILNHWPSRWRGRLETQNDRMSAAQQARRLFDSICSISAGARVLLMGDLNDEVHDPSILNGLGLRKLPVNFARDGPAVPEPQSKVLPCALYETAPQQPEWKGAARGSLKYKGSWYTYDHIFVSGRLFLDTLLWVLPGSKVIHAPDYLLQGDPFWLGRRPLRTHHGYEYLGGFSDHLPVYIDLYFNGPEGRP